MKPSKKDKAIERRLKKQGCKPTWYDGILGWRWHCGCDDNSHGCDSQCSAVTEKGK